MGELVVVSCGAKKIWDKEPGEGPTKAMNAYQGPFFKLNREYAEVFSDRWVILSAKYGFIDPDFVIKENYNVTFKSPSSRPVDIKHLRKQVHKKGLDSFDKVFVLGGSEYANLVELAFTDRHVDIIKPFQHLKGIGYMMGEVRNALDTSQKFNNKISGGNNMPITPFGDIWDRIREHEGEIFHTKTGLEFTFKIQGEGFYPSRTKYRISRSDFKKAYQFYPIEGPGDINQIVRGPTYIWSVLHDKRISSGESKILKSVPKNQKEAFDQEQRSHKSKYRYKEHSKHVPSVSDETRIYITHCSAKKDDSLENMGGRVTPDKLYTALPTQRFMDRCKDQDV